MNEVQILQLSYGNYVSLDDYMKLQQENQQLKEQKNKALNYINNYNSMELRYKNEETMEKFNIVKSILNNRLDYESEEIKSLKEQLKQRDEVIDEAISLIEWFKDNLFLGENTSEFNELLKIFNKYKGDNK